MRLLSTADSRTHLCKGAYVKAFSKFFPLVAALAIAGCNAGGSPNMPTGGGPSQGASSSSAHFVPEWQAKHQARRACKALAGGVQCQVLLVPKHGDSSCSPTSGNCGWRPIDLETRYNLMGSLGKGSGTVVALIELGDLSAAASDLATYRSTFGLGTATFFKYNESGQQSNYPESCEDFGWCVETDLDIQMVSASVSEMHDLSDRRRQLRRRRLRLGERRNDGREARCHDPQQQLGMQRPQLRRELRRSELPELLQYAGCRVFGLLWGRRI